MSKVGVGAWWWGPTQLTQVGPCTVLRDQDSQNELGPRAVTWAFLWNSRPRNCVGGEGLLGPRILSVVGTVDR